MNICEVIYMDKIEWLSLKKKKEKEKEVAPAIYRFLLCEKLNRNQKNTKLYVFQVVASFGTSYVTW